MTANSPPCQEKRTQSPGTTGYLLLGKVDMKEGINVEDSEWVEIRDCKNSKILVGCFCRAPGVKEEEEGGVHEEFKREEY